LNYLNEKHKVRILELLSMWLLDDSEIGSRLKVAAIQRMADELARIGGGSAQDWVYGMKD
jgi:hypothetical protein